MNPARNVAEKNAISILARLLDPKLEYSQQDRRTQVGLFVTHLIDGAAQEIRKELSYNIRPNVYEDPLESERTAREIVIERLEKEGIDLPKAPTYEEEHK